MAQRVLFSQFACGADRVDFVKHPDLLHLPFHSTTNESIWSAAQSLARKLRCKTDLHEATMKIMDNTLIKLADSMERRQRRRYREVLRNSVSLVVVVV